MQLFFLGYSKDRNEMMKVVNSGSFRDPSGFVFRQDGVVYRQVNQSYRADYDKLMETGLFAELVAAKLMLPHEEMPEMNSQGDAYKIIRPLEVPFISYPYEWCFSQLKDAAVLTLEIQKRALAHGMSLKDASAFNVQFVDGRPMFIDTISFERYQEGKPWVAYRQFCMHFLATLTLMKYCDIRMSEWFRVSVDGIPLDLASAILPFRTFFIPSIAMHIHIHAKSQKRYANKGLNKGMINMKMTKFDLSALVDNLEGSINRLEWLPEGTEWVNYYQDTNYSSDGLSNKKELVSEYLRVSGVRSVWDLGANDGTFSRIASELGIETVSFDIDPACVENNYRKVKSSNEKHLLPLFQDLINPSPGIGWANCERNPLSLRGPTDMVMALALIHHLVISNNVQLLMVAQYFATLCIWLIIEFVPKEDTQVQKLLTTRIDIFDKYVVDHFEVEFERYFKIVKKSQIKDSCRRLYLMKKI